MLLKWTNFAYDSLRLKAIDAVFPCAVSCDAIITICAGIALPIDPFSDVVPLGIGRAAP